MKLLEKECDRKQKWKENPWCNVTRSREWRVKWADNLIEWGKKKG